MQIDKLTTRIVSVLKFGPICLALFSCATDPGTTTPTTGSAVFRYDTADFDVLLNIENTTEPYKVTGAAVLFATNDAGERVQATEIEEGTTVEYPETLTFTMPSRCTSPELVSIDRFPLYQIFHYQISSGQCNTSEILASSTLTVHRGGLSRTLNGSAVSSGGSTGKVFKIFTTSTTYQGGFGGLSGGDIKCQARATAAGLSGNWKAILSDSNTSAASRLNFSGTGVIKNVHGYGITNTMTIWSGSIFFTNNYDEFGDEITSVFYTWTGTTPSGGKASNNCTNWTASGTGVTGVQGSVGATDYAWIALSTNTCNQIRRLMCIDLTGTAL